MTRALLPLLVLWAVVGAPTLCAAGVLAHDCECETATVCDHESECERDPCSEQMFRHDEGDQDFDSSSVANLPASTPALGSSEQRAWPRPPPIDRGPPLGLLYTSDLPLLI